MKLKIKTAKGNNEVISYSISILIHALFFVGTLSIMNIYDNRMMVNSTLVQVLSQDINDKSNNPEQNQKQMLKAVEKKAKKEIRTSEKDNEGKANDKILTKTFNNEFYNFSNINADTTGLDQIYHESTLDVTLKYPAGWTFIDQDVKSKLDGVTFWSTIGNYLPPPYIHMEVKDKELFSAQRFKYKSKMWGYTIFYNDPENIEGQITQTIYMRTNSDSDFSFKLIMEGEDAFKSFQPIFFGMIKSFKFGSSFF